jgi:hypothetical protein
MLLQRVPRRLFSAGTCHTENTACGLFMFLYQNIQASLSQPRIPTGGLILSMRLAPFRTVTHRNFHESSTEESEAANQGISI